MGKRRPHAERLDTMFAAMREDQQRKRDAAKAAATAAREARETGAVKAAAGGIVGFTWGKPLSPRTRAQVRRALASHRRKQRGPAAPAR